MDSVQVIRTDDQLDEFFEFIFNQQRGYVYSPTKHPVTHDFEQYFFKWPEEKQELINHTRRFSLTHEVYYSPSIYNQKDSKKESFKGTYFVWAEFDGKIPDSLDIPEPSIKIQSSTEEHEHWYWRLEHFITDKKIAEDISQRLTYHLQADLSGWDCNQVLRPPGTIHHESSKQTAILRWDSRPIKIEEFIGLPDLPIKLLGESDIGFVPNPLDVVAKYPWPVEAIELFKVKDIEPGYISGTGKGRSAALTKMGHFCIEMGMSNAETLAILQHKDGHWKKYLHRRNQKERLLGIINYCRAKHPIDPVEEEIKSPLRVYTYKEFMDTPIEIDWVIKNFIHRKGLVVLFGPTGVGKSQATLRFGEALAKGSKFLKWPIERPMKTIFISMEMHAEELQFVLETMNLTHSQSLDENMLLMPLGASIKLNTKIAQEHLNRVIEEYQPDGILFDSLGIAIGENLSNDETAFKVLDYINSKIRREYGCFAWFIHHPRKEQIGNKKPNRIDDMQGSGYYANETTNTFTLWPNGPLIDVDCLKMRLAPKFESFKIRRTSQLDFEVMEGITNINKDQPIFENPSGEIGEAI